MIISLYYQAHWSSHLIIEPTSSPLNIEHTELIISPYYRAHPDHLTLLSSTPWSSHLVIEQVSFGGLNSSFAPLFAASLLEEALLALPIAANTTAAAARLLLAIGPEAPNGGPLLLLGTAGSRSAAAVQLGHVHRAPVGHHATVGLLGPVQLKHIKIKN